MVHGRGFKPPAEELLELSAAALRAGLERDFPECVSVFDSVRLELAYYGDLNNDLITARGEHYDERIDVGDRRNALKQLRQIPNRKGFGIRQYDRLPGKSALAEFIAGIAAPLLGAVGLWMWMCSRKAPCLAEYLRDGSGYAAETRARVRDRLLALFEDGDRVLLLSHGSGSAIVWDVLWELSHEASGETTAKVDLWLTVGSPLGDRHLRRLLRGAGEPGLRRFPTNVISWFNVAAEDDYICHDNTLADDYRTMLEQHMISTVRDYKIYNHAVRYGRSNPHSSVGYYIHPRVAKILADWLTGDIT